jgi:hypothetical protein
MFFLLLAGLKVLLSWACASAKGGCMKISLLLPISLVAISMAAIAASDETGSIDSHLAHLLQSGRRNFEGIKYSCGFADNIFVRISKCSATFSGLR